jgi:hypothetical protein
MKLPLLVTIVAATCLSLTAQAQVLTADQVPAVVKQGFQARFPTVKRVDWKVKTDQNYEAEFTLKGTEIAAKFDPAGKWLESESAIPRSRLPKAVRVAVAKQFTGYKVVETQTVQRANEKPLIYEVHVENAREIVKAQLSADGAVLNQAAKPKPDKPVKRTK